MLSVSGENMCRSKRLSSSPAAASTIGHNGNILIDILYCLPLKSLCVFKSVSKQWLSLISDPHFKRNYNLRRRPHSKPALFMYKSVRTPVGPEDSEFQTLVMDGRNRMDYIPFNQTAVNCGMPEIKFQQSCNGLLLYEVLDKVRPESPDDYEYHKTHVIYNPSMKHCKTLPSPIFRKSSTGYVQGVTIAFDPAKSSYYEVFGFYIDYSRAATMYQIIIYSSKTNSWRDVGDPFPSSSAGLSCRAGVYYNGSVHWIDRKTATLDYFDMDSGLLKTIALPTYPLQDFFFNIDYFGECRGHILLVDLLEMRKDDMPHIDIWEMRTDYTGWYLKYKVDLSPLKTVYPTRTTPYMFAIQHNFFSYQRFDLDVLLIEDSLRLILCIGKDKVISFDLENKSFKEIYDVKPDVYVEGFEYIETLAD